MKIKGKAQLFLVTLNEREKIQSMLIDVFRLEQVPETPISTFSATYKRKNCGEDELKVTIYRMKEAIVNEIVKQAKSTFQNIAFTVMMDISAV